MLGSSWIAGICSLKVVHREQSRMLVAVIDENLAMIGGVVQELGC